MLARSAPSAVAITRQAQPTASSPHWQARGFFFRCFFLCRFFVPPAGLAEPSQIALLPAAGFSAGHGESRLGFSRGCD